MKSDKFSTGTIDFIREKAVYPRRNYSKITFIQGKAVEIDRFQSHPYRSIMCKVTISSLFLHYLYLKKILSSFNVLSLLVCSSVQYECKIQIADLKIKIKYQKVREEL